MFFASQLDQVLFMKLLTFKVRFALYSRPLFYFLKASFSKIVDSYDHILIVGENWERSVPCLDTNSLPLPLGMMFALYLNISNIIYYIARLQKQ